MMINNFVMSQSILNILNQHSANAAKHLGHIASGLRIQSVVDDPAGWAIGQRMDVQIRGLNAASSNAQNGKSLLKVADGGISSTLDILKTLKEKAIEAASDTATTQDRQTIQKLFDQYADQIDDNALITYNGKYLLDGSHSGATELTQQAFTNENLASNTNLDTKLTDLARRDGSSLNILSSDRVAISYVKDGKTYAKEYDVADTTLQDIFKQMNSIHGDVFDVDNMSTTSTIGKGIHGETVTTADEENGISVKAKQAGTDGVVSGFTIGIMDSQGNMKKSVNTALDAFSETIQARDERSDQALTLQTGTKANQNIRMDLGDIRSTALGLRGADGSVIDVTTQKGANAAMDVLDKALSRVLDQSTTVGAMSSRLDYTISNLTVQSENLLDAKSTLLDADMASEILAYTKENILAQAAMAMLAQNNKNAAWFLSLLGS
ncbi:MAG: flagellin [Selenomonadaceae bacterium]|nr:flagellin [Selenomonadaceae bacterium]